MIGIKKFKWVWITTLLMCVLMVLTGCKNRLSTPTNLAIDQTSLTLTWDEVENATNYVIQVDDKSYVSSKTSYSLSKIEAGEYEIKVKACDGTNAYKDSKWSKEIDFTKEPETGLVYTPVNGNTEYEITSVGTARGDVVIEDVYKGKPVTRIAQKAFYSSGSIKSLVIGSNVTTIGDYAFTNCSNLKTIVIPDSVVTMGEYVFQGCRALEKIDIPSKLTTLKNYSFRYCKNLQEITGGESLITIEESVFADCDKLVSVTIPSSVESLGGSVFAQCNALETVNMGDNLKTLGGHAFFRCEKLTTVNATGLVKIGEYAFSECLELVSITIPNTTTSLGDYAFYACTKLASIKMGENVMKIGVNAFTKTIVGTGSIPSGQTGALIYAGDWVIGYVGVLYSDLDSMLREGTVGIGAWALAKSNLVNVFLPTSVKYIDDYAFYDCEQLVSLDVGKGVTRIGKYAFAHCKRLGRGYLDLGTKTEIIDSYAFYKCDDFGMNNEKNPIELPRTLKTVGTSAFKGTAIWTKAGQGVVYIDDWVVGYIDHPDAANVTLKDGTIAISNYAFYKSVNLTMVTLPDSLKNIGFAAFYECKNLNRVAMDERGSELEEIGDYTFYRCEALLEVTIPRTVQKIGRSAFYKSGIMIAEIPKWVKEIGLYAYYGCENLLQITFAQDSLLESIGDYAFGGCAKMKKIRLPDSLKKMGAKTFYKCLALQSVEFGSQLTEMGEAVFYNCSALKQINLPDSLTYIPEKTFYKCTALEDVQFNDNLTSIGDYAFYKCASLGKVVLPKSITAIGDYAFRGCSILTTIHLTKNIVDMGNHVFNNCKKLTIYVEGAEVPSTWAARWNSGYRPAIFQVTFHEDGYVQSMVVDKATMFNVNDQSIPAAPEREGYDFVGWTAIVEGVEVTYSMEQVKDVAAGTILTAVWQEKAEDA